MTPRSARWIAWTLVAIYFILAAAGLFLQFLTDTTPADTTVPFSFFIFAAVMVGIWPILGAFIVTHHPHHAVGWLLFATFPIVAVDFFTIGYTAYVSRFYPGELVIPGLVYLWLNWSGQPFAIVTLSLMNLLFPTGRLLSPRWRGFAWSGPLLLPVYLLLNALEPGVLGLFPSLDNPFAADQTIWNGLIPIYYSILGILILYYLGSTCSLYLRLHRSRGDERQQIKWLVLPATLFLAATLFALFADLDPSGLYLSITMVLTLTSLPAMIVAVTFAIFKYRLYDIDLIFNRTLVYGSLSAAVALLYIVVVGLTGLIFQTDRNLAALLLATAPVILMVKPLHARIQRQADRLIARPPPRRQSQKRPFRAWTLDLPARISGRLEPDAAAVSRLTLRTRTLRRLAYPLGIAAGLLSFLALGPWFFLTLISSGSSALLSSDLFFPLFTAVHGGVGMMIARRRPRHPLGWLLLAAGWIYPLNLALTVYAEMSARLAQATSHTVAHLENGLWIPAVLLPTLSVSLLFPGDRRPPSRPRPLPQPAFLGLIGAFVILMVLALSGTPGSPSLPGRIHEIIALFHQPVLLGLGLAVGIGTFILRFRRATGFERRQLKWPAYAFSLGFLVVLAGLLIWLLRPDHPHSDELARFLVHLSAAGLTTAAGIALLGSHNVDIDLVINRTVVFGLMGATIIIIYVLAVGWLGSLLPTEGNLILSLAATGLIAVLFQPMRARLQRGVNRLLFGERDDPFEALARLGRRLESLFYPELVYPVIVETIAQTLKLPYVALRVKRGEKLEPVGEIGRADRETVAYPLLDRGEVVGELLAGRRGPDEPFTPADERLLRNFARQAGTAVHAAQLTADLQRSRHQLVTAREEERLRLRRDLHDGLGPVLASIIWRADSARGLLQTDPAEASRLLARSIEQAQGALADIRRLVYGLRPPALDELGLVGALEQSVREVHPTIVRIEATGDLPPLPAAVEVATYRIVQEAIKNAVTHGKARHCQVLLAPQGGSLQVAIWDDGRGLPEIIHTGVGLISMRERAEELGGVLAIHPRPAGGVAVEVRLPLPPAGDGDHE